MSTTFLKNGNLETNGMVVNYFDIAAPKEYTKEEWSKICNDYTLEEATEIFEKYKKYCDRHNCFCIENSKGDNISVAAIGNREMFYKNKFYHIIAADIGALYLAYYDLRNENGEEFEDLSDIDYSKPYMLESMDTDWGLPLLEIELEYEKYVWNKKKINLGRGKNMVKISGHRAAAKEIKKNRCLIWDLVVDKKSGKIITAFCDKCERYWKRSIYDFAELDPYYYVTVNGKVTANAIKKAAKIALKEKERR